MGSLAKRFFAETLRKFCGKFADTCEKKCVFIASGKGAEIPRKVCRKFRANRGTFSAMTPS